MKAHNKTSLKDIRRDLRTESTPAEEVLWEKIRNRKFLKLKFKRQHSIGNYIVDFYCANPLIIIELDGSVHSENEQKQKDIYRDENLRDMNYLVFRFSNEEVLNNAKAVLQQIEAGMHKKMR